MLYNWDAVQFALALREFDVAKHQPHPPGYLLYVALGRLLNASLGDPTLAYVALAMLFSAATTFVVYWLARRLYDRVDGHRGGGAPRREPALLVLRIGRADLRGRGVRRVAGRLVRVRRARGQPARPLPRRAHAGPRWAACVSRCWCCSFRCWVGCALHRRPLALRRLVTRGRRAGRGRALVVPPHGLADGRRGAPMLAPRPSSTARWCSADLRARAAPSTSRSPRRATWRSR